MLIPETSTKLPLPSAKVVGLTILSTIATTTQSVMALAQKASSNTEVLDAKTIATIADDEGYEADDEGCKADGGAVGRRPRHALCVHGEGRG